MRVAVFEWLCGGGLHGLAPCDVPLAMLQEGWAMLSTLVQQFSSADYEVVTMIDGRLVTSLQLASLPPVSVEHFEVVRDDKSGASSAADVANTIKAWLTCASESKVDLALIVAPEIDGVLQQTIAAFCARGLSVLNCSGNFLDRTCDKWLTSQSLQAASLSHPFTRLASDLQGIEVTAHDRWCVKSRLGAGCDEMWVGASQNLRQEVESLGDASRYIVQPWLQGLTFSCSAIVDLHCNANWLPLVTQSFEPVPTGLDSQTLSYRGGKLVDPRTGPQRPIEMLNELLKVLSGAQGDALGWIGVDLLLRPTGEWVIIEVNPRLTTSILGLSQAAPCNLAGAMVAAFQGQEILALAAGPWRAIEFSV